MTAEKVADAGIQLTKYIQSKYKIFHILILLLTMRTALHLRNSILFNSPFFSSRSDNPTREVIAEINHPLRTTAMNGVNQNDDLDEIINNAIRNRNIDEAVQHLRNLPDLTIPSTGRNVRYLSLGCTTPKHENSQYVLPDTSSYTSLLSSNLQDVVRGACGTSGPMYPSVCTQSLISNAVRDAPSPLINNGYYNEEFDVIVLNYYAKGLNGLYDLAKRLRQRYPDAILVILRVYQLSHIKWVKHGKVRSLEEWAVRNEVEFGSDDFFYKLKGKNVNLVYQGFTARDDVLLQIQRELGPVYIRGIPMSKTNDPKETLWNYHHYYSHDFKGLSVAGHLHLYSAIRQAVQEGLQTYYPSNPRAGDWGTGDSCFSWYTSGIFPTNYKEDLVMEHFNFNEDQDLYALSSGVENTIGWGWLVVVNPFDGPRNLLLSYMATTGSEEEESSMYYPRTEIRLYHSMVDDSNNEATEANLISEVIVNPVTDYQQFGGNGSGTGKDDILHTVKTTNVGVVPPGRTRLYWKPLERKSRPFRLTAIKVVSTDVEIGGVLGPAIDYKMSSY